MIKQTTAPVRFKDSIKKLFEEQNLSIIWKYKQFCYNKAKRHEKNPQLRNVQKAEIKRIFKKRKVTK
ncbi:hypothetical protein FTV88_1061 [Heliorestis convoluta]|uniref:Uncharacterized protein n=1 Tax=Heliorestis convoluta TaxID=356322 RepID=A0A5Q2N0E3_9FIRM|nr:hypothetical protein FTV88_1061 [Heliorestis convoluta]